MKRRRRSGFILPFVIVVGAVTTLLALSTTTASWRAYRASHTALAGQRAYYAAESAIEAQIGAWAESVAPTLLVGDEQRHLLLTPAGDTVEVRTRRTHPLVVWLYARALRDRQGAPVRAVQAVTRAMRLAPPRLPLHAAVTVLGSADIPRDALLSGNDIPRAGDACGPYRESASVGALAVSHLVGDTTRAALRLTTPDSLRSIVDAAWPRVAQRSTRTGPFAAPVSLAAQALPPSQPTALPAAQMILGDSVTLVGRSEWHGLLVIDGALILRGSLEVNGILVVRGHIDSRAGELLVRGQVLVVDRFTHGSAFGNNDRVTYDGCAVPLALATVADARSEPFFLWHTMSP